MRRVVLTGLGVVSCLGNNKEDVTRSLKDGKSGISFREEYEEMGMRSHVAGAPDIELKEHIDRKALRFMGDTAAYAHIAMQQAIDETDRRRQIQQAYNLKHDITPESIRKEITPLFGNFYKSETETSTTLSETAAEYDTLDLNTIDDIVAKLEKEMQSAAKALEFEKAADLRDQIQTIKKQAVFEL